MESRLTASPPTGDATISQQGSDLRFETEEEIRRDVDVIKRALASERKPTPEIKKMKYVVYRPLERLHPFASYLSGFTSLERACDYRGRTWGYTIIRTVYGDGWDAKFQTALSAIRRTVQAMCEHDIARRNEDIEGFMEMGGSWPDDMAKTADRQIEDEFERRFVNEIWEDRDRFADATADQVRAYFLPWAQERFDMFNSPPAYSRIQRPANFRFRHCEPCSSRLFACILLDAETVEQLQGLPASPAELYPRLRDFWVKMVEAQPVPRQGPYYYDDGSVCDVYRVRLAHLVDFWFDSSDRNPEKTTEEPDPRDKSIRYYNPSGWVPAEFKMESRIGARAQNEAEWEWEPDPAPDSAHKGSKADTSQFWGSVMDS
ncbi:hypothetical protein PG984_008339 [Apiospora sp. TS-2023a]